MQPQLGLPIICPLVELNSYLLIAMDKLIFDKELEENVEDDAPSPDFKLGNSTNYTRGSFTPFSSFSPFSPFQTTTDSSFPHPIDSSLDLHLYKHNALQLRSATIVYLKHCCICTIDQVKVFTDGNVYTFPNSSEEETEQEVKAQSIFGLSRLLSPWKVRQLFQNFKQFAQLHGLMAQLKEHFGKFIAQELIFVVASVLEVKMEGFRKMQQKQGEDLIPRLERFYGIEGEETILSGGWQIYEDINYDEVKKFASSDLQNVAHQLYISNQLKYLNLTETNVQIHSGVNLLDKFTTWLEFLCGNIFLTMCGMSQNEHDIQQLSMELNFVNNEQGRLEQHILSKRIKRQ